MTTYQELIEAAIEKEIDTIGEEVAVAQAREVEEIVVDDQGKVLEIKGGGKDALSKVVEKYREISGDVAVFIIRRKVSNMDIEGLELPESLR